jgi:hypothetical protein
MAVSSYFAFQKFFNHENPGNFAKQLLHHYQLELDSNESKHDYIHRNQFSNLQAGGRVNRNQDFLLDLTFPGHGVTEFTTSFFTMDLNFILSFGVNNLPLEGENKPDWIPHLGFPSTANRGNPVKWWDDSTCRNLAKNQFMFIGFKNPRDCI